MKPKGKPSPASLVSQSPVEPAKRPTGRPPKGARALTPAERQAAYRKRQWRAQLEAEAGKPDGQPTGAILGALGLLLGNLEDPQKADLHESQRWAAERALGELCARYKLKPQKSP